MPRFAVVLTVLVALSLTSCATSRVSRVAADQAVDLSGRWNDTDAQQTAQAMIDDVLRRPWIADFTSGNNRKPVVVVGDVRNRSSEHIETLVFTKSLERELINSGRVKFVASKQERVAIADERLNQQSNASLDTMKRLGQETGADFFLSGVITSVVDAVDGQKVMFYKITLELTNIETNEKVWIGDKQIKKIIEQAKFKF